MVIYEIIITLVIILIIGSYILHENEKAQKELIINAKKYVIEKISSCKYVSELGIDEVTIGDTYSMMYLNAQLNEYGFEIRKCHDKLDYKIWPLRKKII